MEKIVENTNSDVDQNVISTLNWRPDQKLFKINISIETSSVGRHKLMENHFSHVHHRLRIHKWSSKDASKWIFFIRFLFLDNRKKNFSFPKNNLTEFVLRPFVKVLFCVGKTFSGRRMMSPRTWNCDNGISFNICCSKCLRRPIETCIHSVISVKRIKVL